MEDTQPDKKGWLSQWHATEWPHAKQVYPNRLNKYRNTCQRIRLDLLGFWAIAHLLGRVRRPVPNAGPVWQGGRMGVGAGAFCRKSWRRSGSISNTHGDQIDKATTNARTNDMFERLLGAMPLHSRSMQDQQHTKTNKVKAHNLAGPCMCNVRHVKDCAVTDGKRSTQHNK